MNVCVFLSAADLDERYTRPAREFAELLGKGGHTLVWGGSDTGLMKVVADGVQQAARAAGWDFGGVPEGVGARGRRRDGVRRGPRRTQGAAARQVGAAVVVIAGGLGTLDEATDILEQKKHRLHDKPVVLLNNTAGFYGGLALQLRRMEEEGFLPVALDELVFITDDGARALAHLEDAVAPT